VRNSQNASRKTFPLVKGTEDPNVISIEDRFECEVVRQLIAEGEADKEHEMLC